MNDTKENPALVLGAHLVMVLFAYLVLKGFWGMFLGASVENHVVAGAAAGVTLFVLFYKFPKVSRASHIKNLPAYLIIAGIVYTAFIIAPALWKDFTFVCGYECGFVGE